MCGSSMVGWQRDAWYLAIGKPNVIDHKCRSYFARMCLAGASFAVGRVTSHHVNGVRELPRSPRGGVRVGTLHGSKVGVVRTIPPLAGRENGRSK
eukprot:6479674-Pyramimonas_sp.AAC.1